MEKKSFFTWMSDKVGDIRDYINENESKVVFFLTRALAGVSIVLAIMYAIIFIRQYSLFFEK